MRILFFLLLGCLVLEFGMPSFAEAAPKYSKVELTSKVHKDVCSIILTRHHSLAVTEGLKNVEVVPLEHWTEAEALSYVGKPVRYKRRYSEADATVLGPIVFYNMREFTLLRKLVLNKLFSESKRYEFLEKAEAMGVPKEDLKKGVEVGLWLIKLKSGNVIESEVTTSFSPRCIDSAKLFNKLIAEHKIDYSSIAELEFYHTHPDVNAAAAALSHEDIESVKYFAEYFAKMNLYPKVHILAIAPNSKIDLVGHYGIQLSSKEEKFVAAKAEARQVYLDRMQLIHVKEDRKAEYLRSVAYKFQQLYCEAHNQLVELQGSGYELVPMATDYYGEDAGKAKEHLNRKLQNLSVFPVRYYNAEQKEMARIRFLEGKAFYGDGERLTDTEVSYVMDENGAVFMGHPFWDDKIFDYNFRHSSLNNGEPVAAAGKIKFDKEGRIVSISRESGHYRPKGKHLKQFTDRLKSLGIDLSQAQILDR